MRVVGVRFIAVAMVMTTALVVVVSFAPVSSAHTGTAGGPSASWIVGDNIPTSGNPPNRPINDPFFRVTVDANPSTGRDDLEFDCSFPGADITGWNLWAQWRIINGDGTTGAYSGEINTGDCLPDSFGVRHRSITNIDATQEYEVKLIWKATGAHAANGTVLGHARTTAAFDVPEAPTNFHLVGTTTVSGRGENTVGWTAPATIPDKYQLQRRKGGESSANEYETIYVGPDTEVTDGAAIDVVYSYRVRSCSLTDVCSDWVGPLVVRTGEGAITTPHGGEAEDPDGDTDGDGDASCGLSMFCWIKAALRWAFVPGESFADGFNDFKDLLATKPPFSIAWTGLDLAIDAGAFVKDKFDVYVVSGVNSGEDCASVDIDVLEDPDFCFGSTFHAVADGNVGLVTAIRYGLEILVYLAGGIVVWRILKTSFAKNSDPEGGESALAGGSESKRDDDE